MNVIEKRARRFTQDRCAYCNRWARWEYVVRRRWEADNPLLIVCVCDAHSYQVGHLLGRLGLDEVSSDD